MKIKFKLTESQLLKLYKARKAGTAVTLELNENMIAPNGIPLTLTGTEYNKIQSGGTHNIKISATRVKKGGFLAALLSALPTIASVVGGISGLTGIASNIKSMAAGKGIVTDHIPNIPVLTPLLKTIGLGQRQRRSEAKEQRRNEMKEVDVDRRSKAKRSKAKGISIAPN